MAATDRIGGKRSQNIRWNLNQKKKEGKRSGLIKRAFWKTDPKKNITNREKGKKETPI